MILAFDTSGPRCATALLDGGAIVAARLEDMAKGQAERLMPLIAETLADAGVTLHDLTAIGVGIGPGNFTGIRISVSAGRGLALALGIPAIGVSALEALALDAARPTLTALPAPRGQLYLQRHGEGAARPAALVDFDDLADWLLPGLTIIAPDMLASLAGHHATRPPAHPLAEAIARIAAARAPTPQPRPAPLYLRPADAAPSRHGAPALI